MKLLKSISELIRTQKLIIADFNQMHLLIYLFFCTTTKYQFMPLFLHSMVHSTEIDLQGRVAR